MSALYQIGWSKNTHSTTPKKMVPFDKMILFSELVIANDIGLCLLLCCDKS